MAINDPDFYDKLLEEIMKPEAIVPESPRSLNIRRAVAKLNGVPLESVRRVSRYTCLIQPQGVSVDIPRWLISAYAV